MRMRISTVLILLAPLFFCGEALGVTVDSCRFQAGDDTAWAQPGYEDRDWDESPIPRLFRTCCGSCRGWYRFHFDCPQTQPEGGWAVWLGCVLTADETWLNGVRIGGEGTLGRDFADAPRKERLYALPDRLLKSKDNVLAVRVQSSLPKGGLLHSPYFGPLPQLTREVTRHEVRQLCIESFVLGILALTLGFWGLLSAGPVNRREHGWLGVLIVLISAVFFLESLLFYETGFAGSGAQRILVSLFILLPVPVFMLGAPPAGVSRKAAVVFCRIWFGMALFYLAVGGIGFCRWIESVWLITIMAGVGLLLGQFFWSGRKSFSLVMVCVTAGFVWLGLCGAVEYAVTALSPERFPFSFALHIGFAGLAVALAAALGIQYRQTYRQLRRLSRQLVGSQEEERKRLAAALHNGVAPSLATVKLDLQLLLRRLGAEDEGRRSVKDLSRTISALRDFSHELRPAAIDQLGLCAALRGMAERLADENGWTLNLQLPDEAGMKPVPSDIAVSLYRAAQEALNNTSRHANARTVDLALAHEKGGVHLTVADDGQGCLPGKQAGLGWLTLRERVDALEGTCRIETAPGKGVKIDLWLPLN